MGSRPTALEIFLGSICWAVLLTFLLVPLVLLLISKCVVVLLAWVLHSDLHSVSTGDAAFTIGCSWEKSKLSVGLLCHVQGRLDLEQVQKRFSAVLLEPRVGDRPKYDKLFSCLVTFCGYVFRKFIPPEQIDLSEHIYERRVRPGETLQNLMDDWMQKSYGAQAPAWELIVVPWNGGPLPTGGLYDPNGNVNPMGEGYSMATHAREGGAVNDKDVGLGLHQETIIAFKIHHVFADGYSLLHMLDMLTGATTPYLVKESKESWWKSIADALAMPINLRKLGGPGGPKTNPLKLRHPQSSWTYTVTTVDLSPIKAIRRKYDVHFASIMLTLIVGSIRQFILQSKGEKELPSHFSIVNTLPYEKHPSQKHILCNHWSLGIIKSPIEKDDPFERMVETEKYFLEFHEAGLHKVAVNYLFPLVWLAPKGLAEKALEKDSIGYNCGLTSLVGAQNYQLLGMPIKRIQPLLTLIDSHPFTAFSWFTFSHSNKVDITLAAAPDLFPDPSTLNRVSEYFQLEFNKLCAQCGIPSSSSPSPALTPTPA